MGGLGDADVFAASGSLGVGFHAHGVSVGRRQA